MSLGPRVTWDLVSVGSCVTFVCVQVRTGMQEMRADAAVNSGNTLAAWAELLPAVEAVQMLASAQKAYEAALTQEEDAAVRHRTCTPVAVHPFCQ